MSFTTVNTLDERYLADLIGNEYFLLTTEDESFKLQLDTLNTFLIDLAGGTYSELTNKVIDDVTNLVHANAIQFFATADSDIPKGSPVKIISDPGNVAHVDIATGNDNIVGICEDGILTGNQGSIMVAGVLTGIDTSGYTEGNTMYFQNGTLTEVPNYSIKSQIVGFTLVSNIDGKILITNASSNVTASQVSYDNTSSDLIATTVNDAVDEVNSKINTLQEAVFQQSTAPTTEQGASDGDIWMDTASNTLNVYREYPLGTGVYRWEPLIYKWDDIVDGGSW